MSRGRDGRPETGDGKELVADGSWEHGGNGNFKVQTEKCKVKNAEGAESTEKRVGLGYAICKESLYRKFYISYWLWELTIIMLL